MAGPVRRALATMLAPTSRRRVQSETSIVGLNATMSFAPGVPPPFLRQRLRVTDRALVCTEDARPEVGAHLHHWPPTLWEHAFVSSVDRSFRLRLPHQLPLQVVWLALSDTGHRWPLAAHVRIL